MANQLIIRFDRSAINQDAVNNVDIDIANPHYFLKDSAYDSLQAHLPFSLSDCKFERIYKGLKATYKYSQARNGDMVPIPDFWAAFLLIHPDVTEGDEFSLGDGINTLSPLVKYTGINYVGHSLGGCDPNPTYAISDPELVHQFNLIKDSCGPTLDPFYGINMDSAWRLETGKTFVKVGVYDKAMQGDHRDFSPGISGNAMTKAYGWDFYNHSSLDQNYWPSPREHGSSVAGIIGAIRNNGRDIAGIAGGSFSDTSDVGVTLYNMKIIDDDIIAPGISLPISELSNAVAIGTLFVPDSGYGYGLHVINNSWGVFDSTTSNGPGIRTLNLSDLQELEQAFRQAYRNQVTIVAAAGNNSPLQRIPS